MSLRVRLPRGLAPHSLSSHISFPSKPIAWVTIGFVPAFYDFIPPSHGSAPTFHDFPSLFVS